MLDDVEAFVAEGFEQLVGGQRRRHTALLSLIVRCSRRRFGVRAAGPGWTDGGREPRMPAG
ncbi:hypothetical protein SSIG_07263 [Streptomyces filamentosus NRRL 11379]|uniref:Predicted protein n=1 Tax=Streptomyces filamentosus NRRL 15998 TaxID=457431 RepID=D6AD82_STRFL|nr:predicted protein [Streptomyces filamentosus NRRL 15998]EWS91699.1 hypothetical protein SSIG_07263 [Streptomyces filamentosus NRRL 11379]